MKKLLTSLLFISMFVFYSIPFAFASFLQESNAYYCIYSDITESWYMNDDAIEIIRYEPPYYAIKGNIIFEKFGASTIECMTCIWYYDYNRQVMKCKPIAMTYYDKYGNVLRKSTANIPIKTVSPAAHNEKRNIFCQVGNLYFLDCYHICFFNDDNKKYGLSL